MEDLSTARRFALAITALETDRDVEPVVALYAEQCVCGNALHPDEFHGRDGARAFWLRYRDQFDSVNSTFRQIVDGEGAGALEWDTVGDVAGRPVNYSGVTMLDVDGLLVTRSCAYYDPSTLTTHAAPAADAVASVTDGEAG